MQWYDNNTLGGRFANKLRECLSQKKFKGLIVDNFNIENNGEGMWDISYKGMNFVIEWFYSHNGEFMEVFFYCNSVDTIDDTIDVTSYDYAYDSIVTDASSIDDDVYEIDNLISNCFIAKNVNSIYKKIEKLYNDIESLEGNGNKDVLFEILKQYDLV